MELSVSNKRTSLLPPLQKVFWYRPKESYGFGPLTFTLCHMQRGRRGTRPPSITTLSITKETLDTQQNDYVAGSMFYCYAECRYADCRYADCRGGAKRLFYSFLSDCLSLSSIYTCVCVCVFVCVCAFIVYVYVCVLVC